MKFTKMKILVFDRFKKTFWEKEKMLVVSIFSFSHNVFKRLFSLCLYNLELYGKELNWFASVNIEWPSFSYLKYDYILLKIW